MVLFVDRILRCICNKILLCLACSFLVYSPWFHDTGEFNRGFALVEYHTHRAAAMARRKLIPGRITLFGNEVVTDWAEPEVDVNTEFLFLRQSCFSSGTFNDYQQVVAGK